MYGNIVACVESLLFKFFDSELNVGLQKGVVCDRYFRIVWEFVDLFFNKLRDFPQEHCFFSQLQSVFFMAFLLVIAFSVTITYELTVLEDMSARKKTRVLNFTLISITSPHFVILTSISRDDRCN